MATDDTIRTGKQAQEDTWIAQIEAGIHEGMSFTRATTPEDIEKIVKQAENTSIMMFRIPRATVETGMIGGFDQATFLCHLATRGVIRKVILAFDGWADDPRELWEIPCVNNFCRGLLGPPGSDQCRAVQATLIDEVREAFDDDGNLVNRSAFQIVGSLGLVSMAYPERIYERNPESSTGMLKDIGKAIEIRMQMWEGPKSTPSA